MSKIIIDSSTIYSFSGLVSSNINFKRINHEDWSKDACEILENVIEALLLYDEVCFDKDTIEYGLNGVRELSLLKLPQCSLIESKYGTLGEYQSILESLKITDEKISEIARLIDFDWESFVDPHGNFGCIILNPADAYYDKLCNEFITKYSGALEPHDEFIDRMVFYSIIRFLYYQRLCNYNNAELVIHPNRGILSLCLSGYKRLFQSSRIFKNFESIAYRQNYRFSRWLPIDFNTLRLPLVANYVMKKVDMHNMDSFLETITKLREIPEIKTFREGLSELLHHIKENTTQDISGVSDVSKIIHDLDEAVEYWSKHLHGFPNTHQRIITIGQTTYSVNGNLGIASICYGGSINIETIQLIDENSSTSLKLLTFIHDTLRSSIKYQN